MLEILLLIFLCRRMGSLLRAKGWKPLFMQILVVLSWFGAMFLGAMAYSLYIALTQGPEMVETAMENFSLPLYVWALVSAAMGVSCIFFVAWMLPDRLQPDSREVSFADLS